MVERRGRRSGSTSESSRAEQHEKGRRREGARRRRGYRASVGGTVPARGQEVAPSLKADRSSTRRSSGRPIPPYAQSPHRGGRPASPAAGRQTWSWRRRRSSRCVAAAEMRGGRGGRVVGETRVWGRRGHGAGDWLPRVFTAREETSDADTGILRPQTPGPTRNWSHPSWTYSAKHEVKKEFTIGRSW